MALTSMMAGNLSTPVYTTKMLAFERDFDYDEYHAWTVRYWTVSFAYAAVYVVLIYAGRHYMARRQRFELRLPLIVWSCFLSLFSIAGAVRTIPELVHILRYHGFDESVCSPSYFYGPTAFWAYTFVISKAYELGDTVFIVLRKQPLIFLHWYHHISVMIYVWYSYTDHTAPGRWFMVMNYTVHSFMYTYYAVRAMQFRTPRWVSIFITSIQISQMAMGLFVNLSTYRVKSQGGRYCQQSYENIRYCTMMYLSYFFLFVYFFYSNYVQPKKPAAVDDKKKIAQSTAEFIEGKKAV
jgi:elongation of very long chain fatty acids protein 6